MRIRNISLRVVSLLVLTFVFVVATAVFTLFDIRMQTQNMEDSLAEEARTFAREMDAVWEFMDNSQHTINNTTTGVYEFKGLHCAIVGKSVGAIFSEGNNYSIRYTNFEPRRAQDKPDAFETEALALFNEQKDTQEFFRIVSDDPAEVDRAQTSADNGAAQFRYVQALRVNESCLECHGEPAGEIDVTGFPKEGWTLDSVGGAISIVIPLEQQYQALRENVVRDVGFFLLLATFIGIVVFGLMTVFVLRPLEAMKRAFGEVGEGRLRQSMDDAGTAREVASLIDRFNVMSRELSVTYEELEEQVEACTQDLRRANEELAAQRDNLEALSEKLAKESQVKSDLLSMVNHELRTPLTSIVAFADLLSKHRAGADENEAKALAGIEANSQALMLMINDILEMSRLDAGRVKLSLEVVDVGDVVGIVRATVGPLAAKEHLEFTNEVAPDVPLVQGDFDKLVHVLQNLCGNAVKFTPDGGTVHLGAAFHPASSKDAVDEVWLTVADSGIGIDAADQERIFEKFVQVDSSSTRRYNGTGLGLAIVREYAEMHGGSVSVESELGQGASFVVRIPVSGPVSRETAEKDEKSGSGPSGEDLPKGEQS